jgi:hypothetical protein
LLALLTRIWPARGFSSAPVRRRRISPCSASSPVGRADPTPAALARQRAPRVVAWVDVVDDLSGLEPDARDWTPADAVPDTLRAILAEVGRVYAPFLLANARALERGAERGECAIDGQPWVQRPFPYQGKCLAWLRQGYAELGPQRCGRRAARRTGCEPLFAA